MKEICCKNWLLKKNKFSHTNVSEVKLQRWLAQFPSSARENLFTFLPLAVPVTERQDTCLRKAITPGLMNV